MDDGSLILIRKFLLKSDICGRIIDSNEKDFLHSIEMDNLGNIFTLQLDFMCQKLLKILLKIK